MLTRRYGPVARLNAARREAGLGDDPSNEGASIRDALVTTAAISAAGVLMLGLVAVGLFYLARQRQGDVGGPPLLFVRTRPRVHMTPPPRIYQLGPRRGPRWWRWR